MWLRHFLFFCCAHSILQQKSGKAVFVIRRQQVDKPNQPTFTIFLVNNFYGNCKSGLPFRLLSQVCHTTCSSSSFLTAATVSLSQLHSTAPHPFHCTMLTAILLLHGLAPCRQTHPKQAGCTVPFASCCTAH